MFANEHQFYLSLYQKIREGFLTLTKILLLISPLIRKLDFPLSRRIQGICIPHHLVEP